MLNQQTLRRLSSTIRLIHMTSQLVARNFSRRRSFSSLTAACDVVNNHFSLIAVSNALCSIVKIETSLSLDVITSSYTMAPKIFGDLKMGCYMLDSRFYPYTMSINSSCLTDYLSFGYNFKRNSVQLNNFRRQSALASHKKVKNL